MKQSINFIRILILFLIQTLFLPLKIPFYIIAKIRNIFIRYNFLEIDLPSVFPEEAEATGFAAQFFSGDEMTFLEFINLINEVSNDKQLQGIKLRIKHLEFGWAKLEEIGALLNDLKKAGKKIYIYFENGGNAHYFLASFATKVLSFPAASYSIHNFQIESLHIKKLLEKFDIKAEFLSAGKYKSAAERYTRDKLSPAAKESYMQILEDLESVFISTVSRNRKISKQLVKKLLDNGPYSATELQELKFINELLFLDEIDDYIEKQLQNLEKKFKLRIIEKEKYLNYKKRAAKKIYNLAKTKKIVLLNMEGAIFDGSSREEDQKKEGISAELMCPLIEECTEDDSIKGMIVRINSPGGSATASEKIFHYLEKFAKEKELLVSFSDVAASGGYYIASASSVIFAPASCITGSIGVLMGKFNIKGAYNKIGVDKDILSRGKNSGMYSEYQSFSPQVRKKLQLHMIETYNLFISRVASGRKKKMEKIEAIAQGRVWLGSRAKKIGLVDKTAGLQAAIKQMEKMLNLKKRQKLLIQVEPEANLASTFGKYRKKLLKRNSLFLQSIFIPFFSHSFVSKMIKNSSNIDKNLFLNKQNDTLPKAMLLYSPPYKIEP